MDETQTRLQCLSAAQQRDPNGDVFATAQRYFEWIAGDNVKQQTFTMANGRLKEGQDLLTEAEKLHAWVTQGGKTPVPSKPEQHESVNAVKGQEPRA